MIEYHQISMFHIQELYRTGNPQAIYEEEIDDISCYRYWVLKDVRERPRSEILTPRARQANEQVDAAAEYELAAAPPQEIGERETPEAEEKVRRQRAAFQAEITSQPRLRPSQGPKNRHQMMLQIKHPD